MVPRRTHPALSPPGPCTDRCHNRAQLLHKNKKRLAHKNKKKVLKNKKKKKKEEEEEEEEEVEASVARCLRTPPDGA